MNKNMISFKEFLEETQLNGGIVENLKIIIEKLIQNDTDWFESKNISVLKKERFWILNYNQTPFKNEFNKLTRGLVVEIPTQDWNGDLLSLVKGFPFIRFFNHQEPNADHVDISNSEIIEKLDGTFVSVFFLSNDVNQMIFNTRKMISSDSNDKKRKIQSFNGKKYNFLQLIKNYLSKINFKDLTNTYIFEFIHEATKVVTEYNPNQYGLYLIGVRNNKTFMEYNEQELDEIAKELNVKRPKRFNAINNLDIIDQMFKAASLEQKDFEGFIFRDKKTGNRVKVKDPEYVKKHHKISKSVKPILIGVLNGETDELLSYFPIYKDIVLDLKNKIENFIEKTTEEIQKWHKSELPKERIIEKLFGKRTISKWELRLKNLRKEKISQTKPDHSLDSFIKKLIMYNLDKPYEGIKQAVIDELKELQNSNHLDKILKLIGFTQSVETIETEE